MHRRTSLLRRSLALVAACALFAAAGPLAAQSNAPSDTTPAPPAPPALPALPAPQRLAPVVIVAPAPPRDGVARRLGARHRITALQRENRALSLMLSRQNFEIARLEARLHHLKTVTTDSLQRQIAALDSATAATRALREQMEARLRKAGTRD